MSNNIDIDQMRDIRVKHSELPFVNDKIRIEVILVNENILILKDIADNKVYKIRTPYSDTFTGITLNPGDRAVFRLATYGFNGLRTRLEFHAYIESSEVETAGYDLSSLTTEDKRVRSYTVEHKTWKKWSDEQKEGLEKALERGLTLDEIMEKVDADPSMHFTIGSISTQINRAGWFIKNGIPVRKTDKRAEQVELSA